MYWRNSKQRTATSTITSTYWYKEDTMVNGLINADNWFNIIIYIIMFGAIYLALLVSADE
jgi:hypothetical protein